MSDSDEGTREVVTTTEEEADDRAALGFGWLYLVLLFVIFGVIAALAYSCEREDTAQSGGPGTTVASPTGGADAPTLTPVDLLATIDGDRVTLSGAVPDEGALRQIIALAELQYGVGNVVDALTVDETTTLTGGTFSVTGAALGNDDRPASLQRALATTLGLSEGAFNVTFDATAPDPNPATVTATLAGDTIELAGAVPDQSSQEALVAAAEGIWGSAGVNAGGLSVGDNLTWANGGSVVLSGTVDAGDARPDAFVSAIGGLGGGLTITRDGLDVDSGAEALARSQERLRAELAAEPILFASGSAEIDPVSEAILQRVAQSINAAPGTNVEIVGHTDNTGSLAINMALSADRAQAVLDRLVALGVDAERLSARGAGPNEPVADNATPEGQAANRRIAFEFEGAA